MRASPFRGFLALALTVSAILLVSNKAGAQAVPFDGIVDQDRVQIRAGASTQFYVVGELQRGDKVRVVEVFEGWNRIEPPKGVFSYVSKAFVDAKGDGKSGVVNQDATPVKAANVNPAELSYKLQMQLGKGETVQIVGEDGSFFKIAPPEKAYVFIPPGSVRRAEAETPAPTPAPAPAVEREQPTRTTETPAPTPAARTEQPAPAPEATARREPLEPAPTPAPTDNGDTGRAAPQPRPFDPEPAPAERPVREPEPRETTASNGSSRTVTPDSPAVATAERRLQEVGKMPLSKQPLDELLATYQTLQNRRLSALDQRIVQARIAQIKRNQDLAASIKILGDAKQAGSEPIAIEETRRPLAAGTYNPSRYDAVGQLLASSVYDGETGPRLFRLVDPANSRTIAYVLSSRKVSAAASLGRIVGIMGTPRYDPALKLRVIDVESLDVLEASGPSAGVGPAEPAATRGDSREIQSREPAETEGERMEPTTQPANGAGGANEDDLQK